MFHIHAKGVLGAQECRELIERGEALGFERAAVNHYGEQKAMPSVRNNDRVEFDDKALAATLCARLEERLGEAFPRVFDGRERAKAGSHFRMYRYEPGQYFKTHKDGSFRDGDLESEVTVLFYLNDADGGETVLMPYGKGQAWAHVPIAPKAGDVLMFEHGVWHEGRPVNSGQKFVLRTDLFYPLADGER